ncbi:MAG: molybdate ABC transporter substrate-binding protein [Oscillibacter sp.]|jgi:molybdate transport system substrate-binding protein|nr:molybdate ABC transporter substrate-binding protein [Oscillibacter sp.]
MRKIITLLLTLAMAMSLSACGSSGAASSAAAASSSSEATPVEISVFAAASMTETLNEIIENYKTVAPNVTVTATYDSSGTLLTQIEQGADCNLFISAAQKQMNALDGTLADDADKNPDGQDLLVAGSRVDILENKVALVVPEGNPKNIQNFDDAKAALENGDCLMAMGNSDVPVGQYTGKILTYFGLDEATLASAGLITYGSNVKEVTTQVSEGTVDFGVVYATDAYSAGLTVADTATAEMCGQVLYPASVLNTTTDTAKLDAAQAFLDYLRTDDCSAIFENVGFTVVK